MRLLTMLTATLVAGLTVSAQVPSYVPTDGLMAWYPFDGNADDGSGNAHHGAVTGAVLTTDRNGATDAAYSFAGNCSDRIDMDLPDMANNAAFSISFWAKRDGSGCLNPRLWEFWNGGITTQCGWFNSWDYITFSGVPINTTLNDNEWIHFVLTEDGQDWRTYVNGQLTNTYAQAFVTNSPDFAIGRMNHSAWDSFNGDLDDFGVWNRTLTAQEVEALFLSEPVNRIGGTLQTDGTDDYASFSLPSGWGESSFTVHFSATIEDFGTTSEVDGEHYLFGHALTGQNGDIGFKAQTIPDAQQMRWAFSDDDGDGSLNIIANPVLEANTWYDFTLVFDRTTSQANVYINGAEAGSAAIPSNLSNLESGLPVGLGAFVYPPSSDFRHFHQGQFGDAYFFPAALTASQVEDLALTCSAPLVAGSAHWGVQEDEYVNLATLEPVTRVGGVVSQSAAPCQTSCTNPNIAEPTCSILPEYVPSDDLVAFFALDGNADDLGPNDFQASTASNSFTTDREGNAGLAGDFDGIDDFIEIPSDAILDTIVHELTLAAWVNYTGTDHGAVLVRRDFVGNPQGERHHFQLNVDSDRALSFSAYDNSDLANHNSQTTTPPSMIQAGQWHHIALTYNEGLCTFYVDGSSVFSEDFPGQTLSPNGHWFNIGRVHRAGGNPYFDEFQGGIDEAGIWARALTETELIALATSDANPSIAGCTDEAACNYDAAAATNDGSCEYTQEADYGLDPTLLACAPGITLSAPAGLSGYTWSDGSTGSDLAVSESGTYTLSTSEGESAGCGLEFEQGDYASLNQPISVDSDGYALRARVHFPLPPTECPPGSAAHNQIMSSANPVEWTPLGIRYNGQLTIYWNQNGYHWIESGYNTDALTGWHTVGVVLNGGMAEFYVDDEQVGSAAFTLPTSATLQNLGNYIPTYWNSCQPIGQLDYVQLWLPDGNGQVDATPWNGVTPNHQWDLDCGNATAATQGTVDLTLQGSPEEITFNTACQSTDAVVVTINQNCVTTEFCGEGTIWDEDLGQCISNLPDTVTILETVTVPLQACGVGTHWDEASQTCVADSVATEVINIVAGIQEFTALYEQMQALADSQATLISELQQNYSGCCSAVAEVNVGEENAPDACNNASSIQYQGHDYDIVAIGDQCWFAENLRTWNYRNGDVIPEETDGPTWAGLTTGAAAAFDNDNSNYETFGLLYNWYAVSDSRGICPSGWHGATESDFQALLTAAGGSTEADVTLRSDDVAWIGSNPDSGTDALGFGLLPGGMRDGYYGHGNFQYFQFYGALWTSDFGYKFFLVNGDGEAGIYSNAVSDAGKYARCVKN